MAVGGSTPRSDRKTIAVCRPADLAAGLTAALEAEGFDVLSFPLAQVVDAADDGAALKHAVDDLKRFSGVAFTSVNAVAAVDRALGGRSWPIETTTFAVGRATSDAVIDAGFPVPFVPQAFTAAALGAEAPLEKDAGPVLAPFGELASNDFEVAIAARGGRVERVTAYRTTVPSHPTHLTTQVRQSDLVLVTSPSIVMRLADALAQDGPGLDARRALPPLMAIGPRTAAAVTAADFQLAGIAKPHDDRGLLAATRQFFA